MLLRALMGASFLWKVAPFFSGGVWGLFIGGIARPAPRYTSPKWYARPSPYREYSSYPAGGKQGSREEKSAFT